MLEHFNSQSVNIQKMGFIPLYILQWNKALLSVILFACFPWELTPLILLLCL